MRESEICSGIVMSVLSSCENFTKIVVQLCKRTEKCPIKCISREIKTGDQTQIYREEGVLVITLTLWQHEINTEVGCKMCIAQRPHLAQFFRGPRFVLNQQPGALYYALCPTECFFLISTSFSELFSRLNSEE